MPRKLSGAVPVPLVLLVDDDIDYHETLAWLLAEEGYRVTSAFDGDEALELLAGDLRPDVIILDMMMPVMDGATTLAAVRADPATAGIPVILSTASMVHDEPVEGATALLRKPFEVGDLLALVARLCDGEVAAAAG
jgi:CheY-like chemotaxis protein